MCWINRHGGKVYSTHMEDSSEHHQNMPDRDGTLLVVR